MGETYLAAEHGGGLSTACAGLSLKGAPRHLPSRTGPRRRQGKPRNSRLAEHPPEDRLLRAPAGREADSSPMPAIVTAAPGEGEPSMHCLVDECLALCWSQLGGSKGTSPCADIGARRLLYALRGLPVSGKGRRST